MNKIYSKVWNRELGQLVVASELASSDSAGATTGAGRGQALRLNALALALLAFAAMLDLALVAIAQPVWLYALPAGLLLVAALLLAYFLRQLQARGQASQIKQQLQADFAVLRDLAQKKPKEM